MASWRCVTVFLQPAANSVHLHCTLALAQSFTGSSYVGEIHDRPERADGRGGRLKHDSYSTVVRLTHELYPNERSVTEPFALDWKFTRVPHEGTPTQAGDPRHASIIPKSAGGCAWVTGNPEVSPARGRKVGLSETCIRRVSVSLGRKTCERLTCIAESACWESVACQPTPVAPRPISALAVLRNRV